MINISKFKKILERNFNMKGWESKVQDERKQPIILPGTIFKLGMEMVLFGQKSLLEMERSLEGFDIKILQEILAEAYESLGNLKASYKVLPSGQMRRVGIVDGSDFGGFRGVVFTIAGMVNSPLDIEPYSLGKELKAARNLLSRIKARFFGKGCEDIILEDGLYILKSLKIITMFGYWIYLF
jgi:hypothetical protein